MFNYQSKNMSYRFYKEYFDDMDLEYYGKETEVEDVKIRNQGILEFDFYTEDSPYAQWKILEGFQGFSLYTSYPGLLLGMGTEHRLSKKEILKFGFSFDHVTGLPYIPGSSLKGMLRAYFPGDKKPETESAEYENYIRDILGKPELDVYALKNHIFEGNDVFLGAFPIIEGDRKLLAMDYITPHKNELKGPNPISFLKVKPNVQFAFGFLISDFEGQVTAAEKRQLFETLLLDMGIGAKTNVGFGRFSKEKSKAVLDRSPKRTDGGRNFNHQGKGSGAGKQGGKNSQFRNDRGRR